jgi:hypothetical protein
METDFRGVNRAAPGQWASCIRVMDVLSSNTVSQLFLADNEAAFRFVAQGGSGGGSVADLFELAASQRSSSRIAAMMCSWRSERRRTSS